MNGVVNISFSLSASHTTNKKVVCVCVGFSPPLQTFKRQYFEHATPLYLLDSVCWRPNSKAVRALKAEGREAGLAWQGGGTRVANDQTPAMHNHQTIRPFFDFVSIAPT